MTVSRPFHDTAADTRFPPLLLGALALLTMAGPIATVLYLPAFPRMATELCVIDCL